MGAPRLLDKKLVNAELATQQKRSIDRGVAIAQKVDAVRDLLGQEEARLETFRKESIARVQREIDAKIAERESLEVGNKTLREERILLSAPIDLSEAWAEVKEGRTEIAQRKETLTEQSIGQVVKEDELFEKQTSLEKQAKNIQAKDKLAERTLTEAETKFTQATDMLERAQKEAERVLKESREKENHLRVREEDATNRETYLSEREERNIAHEVDLANRDKKLKRSQEVFIKAQNYIKSKK